MRRLQHVEAFNRMVLRLLDPLAQRYSPAANEIIDQLLELFKEKDRLEKNLVVWYHHSGDAYSTWAVQFIRFAHLRLLKDAKTSFVLRILVDRGSALLPGAKHKEALPIDLWAYDDELIQICPLGSGSESLMRAFGDSSRMYVIGKQSIMGFDLSQSIMGSVALPIPKFEEDLHKIF